MNDQAIASISQRVAKKFPEFSGQRPRITQQKSSQNSNYLLTYSSKAAGPGGRQVRRSIRVVASERGKIIKISTSK
jgi:hypothetical protein